MPNSLRDLNLEVLAVVAARHDLHRTVRFLLGWYIADLASIRLPSLEGGVLPTPKLREEFRSLAIRFIQSEPRHIIKQVPGEAPFTLNPAPDPATVFVGRGNPRTLINELVVLANRIGRQRLARWMTENSGTLLSELEAADLHHLRGPSSSIECDLRASMEGVCGIPIPVARSERLRVIEAPPKPAVKPSYEEARKSIFDHLQAHGWKLSDRTLHVPHATSPDGRIRLWFKAHAVHYTTAGKGERHEYKNALTLGYDMDIREYTPEGFAAKVQSDFAYLEH